MVIPESKQSVLFTAHSGVARAALGTHSTSFCGKDMSGEDCLPGVRPGADQGKMIKSQFGNDIIEPFPCFCIVGGTEYGVYGPIFGEDGLFRETKQEGYGTL